VGWADAGFIGVSQLGQTLGFFGLRPNQPDLRDCVLRWIKRDCRGRGKLGE
jgi:hypothetical protein